MDGTLFEEWLHELVGKFKMQGRKAVMIVNNYPAHPNALGLKAINLQFLPPNTTSCTQAIYQSVNQVYLLYHFLILLTKSIQSQSNL